MRREGVQMYTMKTNPPLSLQRAAILAFLRREIAAGRAPSLADVATTFGFASRNAARKHVQGVLADGLLEQLPGRSVDCNCRAGLPTCCRWRCWAGSRQANRSARISGLTSSCGLTGGCSPTPRITC